MLDEPCVQQRTIALFPGAFRPPHANHYEVVRSLRERADVDEVVVVIANRNRPIPKTTKALDTAVAEAVWSIYLDDDPRVRVETATASGVAHSLQYLDVVAPGDRLLFVVGAEDHASTRTRFSKLRNQERMLPNVTAEIVSGAPNVVDVRATDLRAMLGEGVRGRSRFVDALPSHLTDDQRDAVWEICTNSMVDQHDLDIRNAIDVLADNGMELGEAITPALSEVPSRSYRALCSDGTKAVVKCALDATSASGTRVPDADRRQRLKTERLALKWLHRNLSTRVMIPEVIFHDKPTRTLALTSVLDDGQWLACDLSTGLFDTNVTQSLATFLGEAHTTREPDPFWDREHGDRDHWHSVLSRRTRPALATDLSAEARGALDQLRLTSDQASRPGFRHLNFGTHVARVKGRQVAVVDFERCANVGDPAIDVGSLLGDYIFEGLRQNAQNSATLAVKSVIASYSKTAPSLWSEAASRAVAFAGARLLDDLDAETSATARFDLDVTSAAERLLTIDLGGRPEEAESALLLSVIVNGWFSRLAHSDHPTARRRSLRRSDPLTFWEGHVHRDRDRSKITVEVLGGVPRTTVDVLIDDAWSSAAELDSIGSATVTIDVDRAATSVLVLSEQVAVLEGMIPM